MPLPESAGSAAFSLRLNDSLPSNSWVDNETNGKLYILIINFKKQKTKNHAKDTHQQ